MSTITRQRLAELTDDDLRDLTDFVERAITEKDRFDRNVMRTLVCDILGVCLGKPDWDVLPILLINETRRRAEKKAIEIQFNLCLN
ncbi:hypothetical protein DYU11_18290 [Fibrisoma montanum]|uniref:Uncharacterized protein n=1 Tax=Fibrisoma montanum TaxID=2305895 RepID=A0A418M6D8_9BACT|nr:hypothetical protein [Fibrisoma montanum]RIV21356.1 hypothetical protein DYU11_18290 [Fibrisoma montanum]